MMNFKKYLLKESHHDYEKMDVPDQIRAAIVEEQKAVLQYDAIAKACKDEKVKKVLLDIALEEKIHIKELSAVLREYDLEEDEAEDTAYEELAEM